VVLQDSTSTVRHVGYSRKLWHDLQIPELFASEHYSNLPAQGAEDGRMDTDGEGKEGEVREDIGVGGEVSAFVGV